MVLPATVEWQLAHWEKAGGRGFPANTRWDVDMTTKVVAAKEMPKNSVDNRIGQFQFYSIEKAAAGNVPPPPIMPLIRNDLHS